MSETSSFEWVQPNPKQQLLDQLTASAEKTDAERDELADKFSRIEALLKRLEFQLGAETNPRRSEQLMERMLALSAMREKVTGAVESLTTRMDELLDFADAMDQESVLPPKDE